MTLNITSDNILLRLRGEGDTAITSPRRRLPWVSRPNYLGEIVERIGFAIASRSLGGWPSRSGPCRTSSHGPSLAIPGTRRPSRTTRRARAVFLVL